MGDDKKKVVCRTNLDGHSTIDPYKNKTVHGKLSDVHTILTSQIVTHSRMSLLLVVLPVSILIVDFIIFWWRINKTIIINTLVIIPIWISASKVATYGHPGFITRLIEHSCLPLFLPFRIWNKTNEPAENIHEPITVNMVIAPRWCINNLAFKHTVQILSREMLNKCTFDTEWDSCTMI